MVILEMLDRLEMLEVVVLESLKELVNEGGI